MNAETTDSSTTGSVAVAATAVEGAEAEAEAEAEEEEEEEEEEEAATTGATTATDATSLEAFTDLAGDDAFAETGVGERVGSTAFAVEVFAADFFVAAVLLILILSEELEGIYKRGMLL